MQKHVKSDQPSGLCWRHVDESFPHPESSKATDHYRSPKGLSQHQAGNRMHQQTRGSNEVAEQHLDMEPLWGIPTVSTKDLQDDLWPTNRRFVIMFTGCDHVFLDDIWPSLIIPFHLIVPKSLHQAKSNRNQNISNYTSGSLELLMIGFVCPLDMVLSKETNSSNSFESGFPWPSGTRKSRVVGHQDRSNLSRMGEGP